LRPNDLRNGKLENLIVSFLCGGRKLAPSVLNFKVGKLNRKEDKEKVIPHEILMSNLK
jgi:hypothetical protein